MKKINFIKSVSPQEQNSIARWYRISLFLISSTCVTIAIVQTKQLYNYFDARQHKQKNSQKITNFESILTQQNTLQKKEKLLKSHIAEIKSWSLEKNNPSIFLTQLLNALGSNAALLSCSQTEERFKLTIQIKHPHLIQTIQNKLNKLSSIEIIKLVSLELQGEIYQAYLTGNIKRT